MTNVPDDRTWLRLEPVARDHSLVEGLQARIADPLWLLTRQWQFKELEGEDNGSPVWARVHADVSQLTRYLPHLPDGTAGSIAHLSAIPLERQVENEWQPRTEPAPRFAARAGAHYLRLLHAALDEATLDEYRDGLEDRYRLPALTPTEDPYLRIMGRRSIDGIALYEELALAARPAGGPPSLPPDPPLGAANADVVLSVAQRYLAWYDAVTGRDAPDTSAWVSPRFEYQLAVAAPMRDGDELVLVADEYDSGTLDWNSFDVMPGATLHATLDDLPTGDLTRFVQTRLPTAVTYRGMPNDRWWEFEDAEVDFGRVETASEEVATLVAIEFAMRYGNDFFYFPLRLTVGSVCRITSLVVADTFGSEFLIDPITRVDVADGPFRLFEPSVSSSTGRCDALILFPTATRVLSGSPIEELVLVRDELANLCWVEESVAVDTLGAVLSRRDDYQKRRAQEPDPGPPGDQLLYHTRTRVPDNWYPLLPSNGAASTTLRLSTLEPLPGEPEQPPPWGRLADALEGVEVPAEEVTRAGAVVTRRYQYARWTDGRQHLWVGRQRTARRGDATSGLRFDITTPRPPPT